MPRQTAKQGECAAGCACCTRAQPASQSLEEVEFAKSACAMAQTGNTQKLARLLAQRPECVHSDGTSGARCAHPDAKRRMLEAGLYTKGLLWRAGSSGYTPIHYAARAGHFAAVQMLLDAGASAAVGCADLRA